MNKKLMITGAMILAFSLAFVGCSNDKAEATKEESKVETKVEATSEETPAAEASVSLAGLGTEPVLVTSFGQSADVAMLKALFKKVGVEITFDPVVKADGLGDAKTLFVAAGASTKGLGAAGIKPEEELERAKAIVEAAKEKDMTIIAVHLGGSARRGDLSDQFITLAVDDAKGMIVVAEGNEDNFFTEKSEEKSMPLSVVDSIAKAVEPLTEMFGAE